MFCRIAVLKKTFKIHGKTAVSSKQMFRTKQDKTKNICKDLFCYLLICWNCQLCILEYAKIFNSGINFRKLTHLFPMHPFYTLWKHHKTSGIKFENMLKKGRWFCVIIARNKLLEKALWTCSNLNAMTVNQSFGV